MVVLRRSAAWRGHSRRQPEPVPPNRSTCGEDPSAARARARSRIRSARIHLGHSCGRGSAPRRRRNVARLGYRRRSSAGGAIPDRPSFQELLSREATSSSGSPVSTQHPREGTDPARAFRFPPEDRGSWRDRSNLSLRFLIFVVWRREALAAPPGPPAITRHGRLRRYRIPEQAACMSSVLRTSMRVTDGGQADCDRESVTVDTTQHRARQWQPQSTLERC